MKRLVRNRSLKTELPYDGQELSMVILLPKAGQFEAFEKLSNAEVIKGILGKLKERQVALTMRWLHAFCHKTAYQLCSGYPR